MVLNNRGQTVFYGFMLAVTIVVLALAFAKPIHEAVSESRNETTSYGGTGMNCTNTDLSNYDKAACVISDLSPFTFIGILIFIAGAVIASKYVFSWKLNGKILHW